MRKKYLSALLFGALLFASAGTFTSCKDYDDDINNLQGQIDGNEASLTEKLTAVENSISSLQQAQTTMQTDIANAQQAAQDAQASADEAAKAAADAKLAATEAQANAIAEAQKQLEAAKAELTELIQQGDAATQSAIDAANAEIAKVQGAVQALQAWQGTTEETLKSLAEADAALEISLAGVQEELTDVANRVGKLETGLKTQEETLAAYKTENAANLTEIEGELATLNEAVQKLAGLEPDDLVNMKNDIATLEGQVTSLSNSINTINESLNILYIAVYKGITHVALESGTCVETGRYYSSSSLRLLSDIAVQSYTFGSNKYGTADIKHMEDVTVENGVTFEKGKRMRQTAYALIRVSPADATVNKEDIHLIDSKGNDLVGMNLVRVKDVVPFEGTLGTRAVNSTTGLFEVQFEVGSKADEDENKFDGEFVDAVTTKDQMNKEYAIDFAISIQPTNTQDTPTEAIDRNVVTAYSLHLNPTDKNENAGKLKFKLYKDDITKYTPVDDIYNRFDGNENEKIEPVEYKWDNYKTKAEIIYNGGNKNVQQDKWDDVRSDEEAYSVKSGEDFYVDLTEMNFTTDQNNNKVPKKSFVKYYYIVLDRDFVLNNNSDSELAAWDSYEEHITGINQVFTAENPEDAVVKMNIDIKYSDVIGFRVYAANADGSLVDPDGKAFYVQVGEPAATITVPTQDIVAVSAYDRELDMRSGFISVDNLEGWDDLIAAAEAANATSVDVELDSKMKEAIRGDKGDVDEGTLYKDNRENLLDVFHVEYYNDDIEGTGYKILNATVDQLKKVKYIKIVFDAPANRLVDNEPYTGKLTFKVGSKADDGGTTTIIGTMDLSAKKVMPTVPTGYSAKTNQIVDGKYLCYVLPEDVNVVPLEDNKMDGYMNLTNSFNLMTDFHTWNNKGEAVYETTADSHYTFTFAKAAYDDNEYVINNIVKSPDSYKLHLDNSFIEDGEGYETTVHYDFGNISYVYDEVTNKFVVKNWTKKIDSFTTNFRCIANSETQTWNWVEKSSFLNKANEGELTYGVAEGKDSPFVLTAIQGKNSYDNTKYGLTFDKFWETDIIGNEWDPTEVERKITKVELITKANGRVNEYFVPSIATGMARVEFTPTQEAAPQADVKSTLRIVFKDKFEHDVVVELPMNVHIDKGE